MGSDEATYKDRRRVARTLSFPFLSPTAITWPRPLSPRQPSSPPPLASRRRPSFGMAPKPKVGKGKAPARAPAPSRHETAAPPSEGTGAHVQHSASAPGGGTRAKPLTTKAPTAQRDRQRASVVDPQPNPAASPSKRAEPLQTKPAKTYRRKAATETHVNLSASPSKTADPTRAGASKPTRKRSAVDPPFQPVVGKRRRAAAIMSGGVPPASADDDMRDSRSDGPPASSEASLVGDQREGGTPSLPSEHGRTGRSTAIDENYVPPPAEGTHHAPPPDEEADVIPVTLEAFENQFSTVPLPPVWSACGACLRRILRRACDSFRYSPVLDDTLCISSTRSGAGVCDNCSANRKRCLDVSVLLSLL